MFHIIVYDITKDPLRKQVSKLLVAHGTRVQKSVFELDLPSSKVMFLLQKLKSIVEDGDSIRCYSLCQNCQITAQAQNDVPLATDKPYYQV